MPGIPELDGAASAAQDWVDALMRRLEWRDQKKVYSVLLAGLHALRDCLPKDEVVYLGAQLPPLLRGLYYEGWRPTGRPSAVRSRDVFLERIHGGVHHEPGIDAEQAARAVFALLAERLPPAELEDTKAATPKLLRALWPS
jgi:uncharacterized protein (DUF2267 family)